MKEKKMKHSITVANRSLANKSLFESEDNKSNTLFSLNGQTSYAFNAAVGMFVLFSVFFLFVLLALLIFSLETNMLAVTVLAAVLLSIAIIMTVLVTSHAIENDY
jgi:uncharacterized membrane protein